MSHDYFDDHHGFDPLHHDHGYEPVHFDHHSFDPHHAHDHFHFEPSHDHGPLLPKLPLPESHPAHKVTEAVNHVAEKVDHAFEAVEHGAEVAEHMHGTKIEKAAKSLIDKFKKAHWSTQTAIVGGTAIVGATIGYWVFKAKHQQNEHKEAPGPHV